MHAAFDEASSELLTDADRLHERLVLAAVETVARRENRKPAEGVEARAFAGWNADELTFVVHPEQHDDGAKSFLGQTGNFDGVEVIDIILDQPATADFIAKNPNTMQAMTNAVVRAILWMQRASIARAREAGLTFRPLAETIRGTLELAQPVEGVGLTPERERDLLVP